MHRLALVTLLLVGCADTGDEGLIILNNTASTESCSFTGAKDQAFNAHGIIWTGSDQGYLLTPLVQSRITLTEGETDETPRTIFMTGANVTLSVVATTVEDSDSGAFTNASVTLSGADAQFSKLFSGSLPPSGTANVGFEIIPVATLRTIFNAVNPGPPQSFHAEVLATVSIFGTLNGDDVESPRFQFPVTVCNNCVAANRTDPCTDFTGTARTGNACNMFQDGVVDCCTNSKNQLVCPAKTEVIEPPPMQ